MRSPPGRRAVASAVLTLLPVFFAGCAASGVEPGEWANRVCRTLKPWTEEISTLTRDAQLEMTEATSPEQAKASILVLLNGAELASEDARRGVAAAGVPAVENGDVIAAEFGAALGAARDAYGSARRRVAVLSTRSPNVFYDDVEEAMDRLSTDYREGSLDTSDLSSKELQHAFDESSECR